MSGEDSQHYVDPRVLQLDPPLSIAQNVEARKMSFTSQGIAILSWGHPSPEVEQNLTDALEKDESSKGKLVRRGAYGSELSKASLNFIMYGISKERERYIYSLLQSCDTVGEGESGDENSDTPGEPLIVDCSREDKDLGGPGKYRLGPYGYAQRQSLSLVRLLRDTVQFPAYLGSQKQHKAQVQQRSDPSPLRLQKGDVLLLDTDLCLNWPLAGSDGCFVGRTFAKGPQRFNLKRDYPVLDVAPFHATPSIRRLELSRANELSGGTKAA
ncbi:hypothetical protein PISL3812_09910 [Talaromyces islandicus]|uniref:Uncharacterized protein n=1 Tax=Talaromyces islandicus TaxID=28573 RepID=A0A0U1MBC4_TALIS|nr:hypothetical protein PISL3812_09910 [Talaromyces islandicus]